jgi:RsiW-degrading membrane proteinase PrsW (M82 family)
MLLMLGVGVLFFLIFVSSIPAIVVFLWFSLARYPFSLLRFSFSLLAGAVAFSPALILQHIFLPQGTTFIYVMGKWGPAAVIFARAFTEELSRLIMLIILFFGIHRLNAIRQRGQALAGPPDSNLIPAVSEDTMAGASGLIAGLGFAILENAVYAASNPDTLLPRIFTAALLHGACGFRVGSAAIMFKDHPIQAFFRFLSAVIIHGIYNNMLKISGIFPLIAAVLIALTTLASSILVIRNGMKGETPAT